MIIAKRVAIRCALSAYSKHAARNPIPGFMPPMGSTSGMIDPRTVTRDELTRLSQDEIDEVLGRILFLPDPATGYWIMAVDQPADTPKVYEAPPWESGWSPSRKLSSLRWTGFVGLKSLPWAFQS